MDRIMNKEELAKENKKLRTAFVGCMVTLRNVKNAVNDPNEPFQAISDYVSVMSSATMNSYADLVAEIEKDG